jgi:hypothetical protein
LLVAVAVVVTIFLLLAGQVVVEQVAIVILQIKLFPVLLIIQ